MSLFQAEFDWVAYFKKIQATFDRVGTQRDEFHLNNHGFVPTEKDATVCKVCHHSKDDEKVNVFNSELKRLQNVMDAINILRGIDNDSTLNDFARMMIFDPPHEVWKETKK